MKQSQSNIINSVKQAVAKAFNLNSDEVAVGYPPNASWGDLTVPCFSLSKKLNQAPAAIAQQLADLCQQSAKLKKIIKSIAAQGPYLNFTLKDAALILEAQRCVIKKNWLGLLPKAKTMVEFLSPNTNKPLHLGHLRNAALGEAVANILKAGGHKVIKASLINDRGIHISKSMLAWQKWASGETPQSTGIKGDHFVGNWYVRFAQELEKDPNLINEAQVMLQKWEAGDVKILWLWRQMNRWVISGFNATLKRLDIKFDRVYLESQTYKLGKDIVAQGLKRGLFAKKEDGSVVYLLPQTEFGLDQNNLPKIVLLQRADGTSVYITQDIGTAVKRAEDYGLSRSIYVVGSEQDYHFKCLFAVLKALGYNWAKDCYHLSYGMVNLPEGKMKSRTGKVVEADDLMDEMVERAASLLREKNSNITAAEVKDRAEVIGLGAMKFFLLLSSPNNDIKYDPASAIALDGITATYCQYAAVRARNILVKAKDKGLKPNYSAVKSNNQMDNVFGPAERALAQKLLQLPEQIKISAATLCPSVLTRHIYEISQAFNQFYHASRVLEEGASEVNIKIKLLLVKAALDAITEGLSLLGIKTPLKM